MKAVNIRWGADTFGDHQTTKSVEVRFTHESFRCDAGHRSLEAQRNCVKLDPKDVMWLV